MNEMIDSTAMQDFNRVRNQETFFRILNLFTPAKQQLLSLREVREILKPKSESYRGMQVVPISHIVGSEGRYNDFNKGFLPKHEHMRRRWTNVDKAHLTDTILPSIKLYEIGGVYFVRDGNHRVSVARAQGVMSIDAEVISLDSEIKLSPNLTRDNLKKAIIDYEKRSFCEETGFDKLLPGADLGFSATGRYDEVLNHIYGHKYFINQHRSEEISISDAMVSWYNNVYKPIVDIIEEERILNRFPGRTPADLYVWIVKHWDLLKKKYGEAYPIEEAVKDFSKRHGKDFPTRLKEFFKRMLKKAGK